MLAEPTANSATEAALVHAVQAGDAAAFEPLVDAHLDHLRAFIALKLPIAHLVDEVAHETFIFAFRNLARFTPGTSFRAWLRAIAANLIRAEVQRYAREQQNQLNYARARALQDYGLYVKDAFDGEWFTEWHQAGSPHLVICADLASPADLPPNFHAQLGQVIRHLQVVVNNGPQTIGGGGQPRVKTPPPPFAPQP